MTWFRWIGSDLLLQVHIQPGAKRSEIAGLHGDCLKLRIHAPPVDGKANAELVSFLADAFAVSKQHVQIEQGSAARRKTIHVCMPRHLPEALLALGISLPEKPLAPH